MATLPETVARVEIHTQCGTVTKPPLGGGHCIHSRLGGGSRATGMILSTHRDSHAVQSGDQATAWRWSLYPLPIGGWILPDGDDSYAKRKKSGWVRVWRSATAAVSLLSSGP